MTDNDASNTIRDIIGEVMEVEDFTIGSRDDASVRARGSLTRPSDEAFAHLESKLAEVGHTPLLFREEGQEHVMAVESEVMAPTKPVVWLAIILFFLALVRVAQLGIQQDAPVSTTLLGDYFRNWTAGLPFVLAIFGILGLRELARLLVARLHGASISPPYLIPMPGLLSLLLPAAAFVLGQRGAVLVFLLSQRFLVPWGTFGGLVSLRAPVRNRRVVFDMAAAAALTGFVASLLVLVVGLLQSEVIALDFTQPFLLEGQSLGYRLVKLALFGQWLPQMRLGGEDVLISTLALAGWAGLTLNIMHLLPFGSLDGGHILYSVVGHRAAWGRLLVGIVLVGLTYFYLGWLFWLVLMVIFARRMPEVLDEVTSLGAVRIAGAIFLFLLLILFFVPIPFVLVPSLVAGPGA